MRKSNPLLNVNMSKLNKDMSITQPITVTGIANTVKIVKKFFLKKNL